MAADGLDSLFSRQIQRGREVVTLLHLPIDLQHLFLSLPPSSSSTGGSLPHALEANKTSQVALGYIIFIFL